MSSFDILNMALRNLLKRKMRTFLTVLGVIIGATAIIIMISIGVGVNLSFEEQINSMQNATVIELYNGGRYYKNDMSAPVLDDDMISAISKINGVDVVTPTLHINLYAKSGKYISDNIQILGMDLNTIEAFGYKISEGEMIADDNEFGILYSPSTASSFRSERDRNRYDWRRQGVTSQETKVNVLEDKITYSFDWNYIQPQQQEVSGFGSDDPDPYVEPSQDENQQTYVPPKPYTFKGVGLLDSSSNSQASYTSIMSIATVTKIQEEMYKWQKNQGYGTQETDGYQQALIRCKTIDDMEGVTEELEKMGFTNVWNPTAFIGTLKGMMATLQTMLSAIGGVSLFVAAIGIANTMVMSIYERTREIGVMKVIGASLKDIKKLFLVEAALIGLMGGTLGVGLSYIVSYIMNNMEISLFGDLLYGMSQDTTKLSVIPVWLVLLALVFSAIIGLISGYFPARRATKLSALNAITTQ